MVEIARDKTGDISVSSYNVNDKTWEKDIYKQKAYAQYIDSLCTLSNNRLLSGGYDNSIKVWTSSEEKLIPIKVINEHTGWVRKLIPLSNDSFATYSLDNTVRIREIIFFIFIICVCINTFDILQCKKF